MGKHINLLFCNEFSSKSKVVCGSFFALCFAIEQREAARQSKQQAFKSEKMLSLISSLARK